MDSFQAICRICESRDNLCDLTNKHNETVAEKLTSLTTIRIQPDDLLPRCICVDCVNTLHVAYEFLLRCEAAEQRLQVRIQKHLQAESHEPEASAENPIVLGAVEYLVDVPGEHGPEEDSVLIEDMKAENDDESTSETDLENCNSTDETKDTDSLDQTQDENLQYESLSVKYTIEEYLEENNENEQKVCTKKQYETYVTFERSARRSALQENGDKLFCCETCGERFEKCNELYLHVKGHGKKRFQCKVCDRWFYRRAHLQSHEVIHTGERNFRCNSCPNMYKSSRNLRRHIKSAHLGEKPFVCDLCGKEFSQKTVLEAHHNTHIQEKNYSCEVCSKKFKSNKLLKLHILRHVRTEQPKQDTAPLECDICHKFYSSKLSLRSHKQTHADAKIACTFCGKSFKIMAHLKVHLRSHTKEQPYECEECHKKFGYESSLRSHRLVHSNQRPYKCDICDVSFRQLNHLKGHKILHSGQKPFECTVCKKSFAQRGNLTIHMRIHGGPSSSPFQCRLCESKKLNNSNALKRHLKVHPTAKVVKIGNLTVIVPEQDGHGEESDDRDLQDDEDDAGGAGEVSQREEVLYKKEKEI